MDLDKNVAELKLDRAAFTSWLFQDAENNSSDVERMKKALAIILKEYVTEKQKDYIYLFFFENMSQTEIAELYGIDKSSVSRVMHAGLRNIYKFLRFSSAQMMEIPFLDMRMCKRVRERDAKNTVRRERKEVKRHAEDSWCERKEA